MDTNLDRPAPACGDLAQRLALHCADLLGLPGFGADSDFFAEGGDSLAAAQLVGLLARQVPDRSLSELIAALFSQRTPAAIAAYLRRETRARAPAPAPLDGIAPVASAAAGPVALSPLQLPIWISERFRPGTPKWNVVTAVRLLGEVDPDRLIAAVRNCTAQHEALGTRIGRAGTGFVQTFDAWPAALRLEPQLAELPAPSRAGALVETLRGEVGRPFDLDAGPLFRARVLRLSGTETVLVVSAHHAIVDGWSVSVLLRDIAEAYRGEAGARPGLHGRYAAILRNWEPIHGASASRAIGYWGSRFPDGWPRSDAVHDQPAPSRDPQPAPSRDPRHAPSRDAPSPSRPPEPVRHRLSPELFTQLAARCAAHGATPFVAVLAAFGKVLADIAGQSEAVIGAAVSRRNAERAGELVGVFLNFVPAVVRVVAGRPFVETVTATHRLWLESLPFQDAPFAAIQREIGAKTRGRGSLQLPFAINFHNYPAADLPIPGVEARIEHLATGHAQGELALNIRPARDGTAELELLVFDGRISAGRAHAMLRDSVALLHEFMS